MNPLDLIYCWQALLVAVACVGITQLAKTLIDSTMGKERRKDSVVLTRFVLPMMPIVVGVLVAVLIPVRPEVLIDYVSARVNNTWGELSTYALWGGACGQFADYTFTKAKAAFVDVRERRLSSPDDLAPPSMR
jgi:hypothetical protein